MTREKTTVTATPPHELDTPMEWSAEDEIQLLFALDGLKPVGINKHFNMLFISERLSKSLNRDIATDTIWTHLRTIYNLDALDEIEPLPFPNEVRDFSLPELEFAALLSKKRAESEEKRLSDGGSSTDTTIKAGHSRKECRAELFRVHENIAPHQTTINRWYNEFLRGRKSLQDEIREGRPSTAVTKETIATVQKLIEDDSRVTIRFIRESLGIGISQIQKILHSHLRVKKIGDRWVPNTEQDEDQVDELVEETDSDSNEEKSNSKSNSSQHSRDMERKVAAKLADVPKRSQKRTRGSMSLESSSPSTTPPPIQKRRRI